MEESIKVAQQFFRENDFHEWSDWDALEDKLADLIREELLKAVQEYQNPPRKAGFGHVPEGKEAVALEPGTLRVPTTEGGFTEVEAWFFQWEGMKLAVSKNVRVITLKEDEERQWRITEPDSGMACPDVYGKTAVDCYANFIRMMPELDKRVRDGSVNKFKTLAERLKYIASQVPEKARLKCSKRDQ